MNYEARFSSLRGSFPERDQTFSALISMSVCFLCYQAGPQHRQTLILQLDTPTSWAPVWQTVALLLPWSSQTVPATRACLLLPSATEVRPCMKSCQVCFVTSH